MNYTVKLEEITLKEAVGELKENRVVFYTYKTNERKMLWEVTKDKIQFVVFKSVLDSEEVLFLRAISLVENVSFNTNVKYSKRSD